MPAKIVRSVTRSRKHPGSALGRLAVFLVVVLIPGSSSAQLPGWNGPYGSILDDTETADRGARALRMLYDMDSAGARLAIDSLKQAYPGHPIGPFLDGLVIWWRILPDLSTGDRSLDADFFRAMDRTVAAANRLRKKKRYPLDAKFFKAAALGFRGRHRSNRREWLTAARDGKEALDLVFELSEEDPDNPDFQFGVGVYNYFASVIPDEYPMVRPFMFFFPKADAEKGLAELERTARDASFVGTEAAYFLLQIHLAYKPDFDESLRMVNLLRSRHPANAYFHALEGRVHARWGHWTRAVEIYESVLALHASSAAGYTEGLAEYALYYLGRGRVASGNLEGALEAFGRLEADTADRPNSIYRALGRLRTGMALDRANRRPDAIRSYRGVLDLPNVADSHDMAERYIKRPFGT
jgi:tetratricopeptide (TPR) repeat protein